MTSPFNFRPSPQLEQSAKAIDNELAILQDEVDSDPYEGVTPALAWLKDEVATQTKQTAKRDEYFTDENLGMTIREIAAKKRAQVSAEVTAQVGEAVLGVEDPAEQDALLSGLAEKMGGKPDPYAIGDRTSAINNKSTMGGGIGTQGMGAGTLDFGPEQQADMMTNLRAQGVLTKMTKDGKMLIAGSQIPWGEGVLDADPAMQTVVTKARKETYDLMNGRGTPEQANTLLQQLEPELFAEASRALRELIANPPTRPDDVRLQEPNSAMMIAAAVAAVLMPNKAAQFLAIPFKFQLAQQQQAQSRQDAQYGMDRQDWGTAIKGAMGEVSDAAGIVENSQRLGTQANIAQATLDQRDRNTDIVTHARNVRDAYKAFYSDKSDASVKEQARQQLIQMGEVDPGEGVVTTAEEGRKARTGQINTSAEYTRAKIATEKIVQDLKRAGIKLSDARVKQIEKVTSLLGPRFEMDKLKALAYIENLEAMQSFRAEEIDIKKLTAAGKVYTEVMNDLNLEATALRKANESYKVKVAEAQAALVAATDPAEKTQIQGYIDSLKGYIADNVEKIGELGTTYNQMQTERKWAGQFAGAAQGEEKGFWEKIIPKASAPKGA